MKLQIIGILPLVRSPNEVGVKIHCPEPIPDGYHKEDSPIGGKEMWRYMLNAALFKLEEARHLIYAKVIFGESEISIFVPGDKIDYLEFASILKGNDRFEFLLEEASAAQAA